MIVRQRVRLVSNMNLLLIWEMIKNTFSNKISSAPTFGKVVRVLRILIVLGILSVDIFTMIINYFQVIIRYSIFVLLNREIDPYT